MQICIGDVERKLSIYLFTLARDKDKCDYMTCSKTRIKPSET